MTSRTKSTCLHLFNHFQGAKKMEQENATKLGNSKQGKSKHSPKLKAFGIIQKNFAIAGITPSLANQSYPFNGRILFGILVLGACIYSMSVFILYEADSFLEYTQSTYAGSLVTLIIFVLLIIIFKVRKLFELISGCDDLIKTGEYKNQIFNISCNALLKGDNESEH